MSIQVLDFASPFFDVKYIENEKDYFINKLSLVFNLSFKNQKCLFVKNIPVLPLKGTIVKNIAITSIDRAIIVEDYEKNAKDPDFFKRIMRSWPSLYETSGLERHKGIPYYRSPKVKLGGDLSVNFCYAEPNAPSGKHKDHIPDFDEVHAQIIGFGKMQKFTTNETNTFYQEVIMAPGIVHDKFYDESGSYPWHQYHSITDCIYMPIEMDR